MKKATWKKYAAWILMAEAAGALAGWLTREETQIYTMLQQPPLAPPAIVFPVVWGILYALMGIGAARIRLTPESSERERSLLLFWIQLSVNFFWSILFFQLQAFGPALLWLILLWLLILGMIASFRKVDPLTAWLQIPYLLWVTYAAYLNFGIWRLNS